MGVLGRAMIAIPRSATATAVRVASSRCKAAKVLVKTRRVARFCYLWPSGRAQRSDVFRRTGLQSWCAPASRLHEVHVTTPTVIWGQTSTARMRRPRTQPYGGCAAQPATAAPLLGPRDARFARRRRLGSRTPTVQRMREAAPPTHTPHSAPWAPTLARALRAATAAAFFWRAASYCFGRERETQRAAPTRPTHNTGQGRLVPRRGRAPAARDRGPRHAQVVRPRGAPAGPHGQAVSGTVAQPAEPRHQQAALDGRRGQGHPAELRAVRRALGRHRPGPAGAHGQRRQEPLELFDAAEDRAVRV